MYVYGPHACLMSLRSGVKILWSWKYGWLAVHTHVGTVDWRASSTLSAEPSLQPAMYALLLLFEKVYLVQAGRSWNSLCRSGWPWTQKSPSCLCLPGAGIKGLYHHTWGFGYFFLLVLKKGLSLSQTSLQTLSNPLASATCWDNRCCWCTLSAQVVVTRPFPLTSVPTWLLMAPDHPVYHFPTPML